MSEKHKLPSGAELDVTPLSTEKAWAVSQVFARTVEGVSISELRGLDWKAIMLADVASSSGEVLAFKGVLCAVLADIALLAAAKECLARCTYNGVAVDSETFDKARGDYLPALFYALKDNIAPFFESLLSALSIAK